MPFNSPGTAGAAANSLAIIEARRKVGDIRSARHVGMQWKRALPVGRVASVRRYKRQSLGLLAKLGTSQGAASWIRVTR